MMIAHIKPRLALVALVLATASAPAQDLGWFAGLGIGYLKADDECPGAAVGAACDDKATVWKMFGGYQFNPYLGFELGLSDMGDWPASVAGLGAATAKIRVFEVVLVGIYPLSTRVDVYGKAGVFTWDGDFEFPAGAAGGADADGNDYTYGLGLRVHVTRNAALRLEWQRYNNLGEQSMTGRFDADVFGVGALLRF